MPVSRLVSRDCERPVALAAGIAILESGGPCQGLEVTLGGGCIARADGPLGRAGLLQRLVGHRLLLAFAADGPPECAVLPARELEIDPGTKEILDLARPVG